MKKALLVFVFEAKMLIYRLQALSKGNGKLVG
jgi:hypothetical protein